MPLTPSYLDQVRAKPEATRHGLALALAGVLTVAILAGWLAFWRIGQAVPAAADQPTATTVGPIERLWETVKAEVANVGRGASELKTLWQSNFN